MALSPASVRNVMQDLEELGLIYAPHTSAGRLPTELGLRFFVDAMLELGDIGPGEREQIEAQVKAAAQEQSLEAALGDAMSMLSGLTRGAGVVVTTKDNARLKQIEFVRIEPERALADPRRRGRIGREPHPPYPRPAAGFGSGRGRRISLTRASAAARSPELESEIEASHQAAESRARRIDDAADRRRPRLLGRRLRRRISSSSSAARPICCRI